MIIVFNETKTFRVNSSLAFHFHYVNGSEMQRGEFSVQKIVPIMEYIMTPLALLELLALYALLA